MLLCNRDDMMLKGALIWPTHRYKSQSTLKSRGRSCPRKTGQSSDPQGGGGGEGVASAIEHSSDRTQQSSSSEYHTILMNRHVLDRQDLLCYNSSATELNID